MAQTTTAYTPRNARVALSTDGSSYTDVSGSTTAFSAGDGTRLIGSAHTLEGEGPIIGAGKLDVQTSSFTFLYTETAGEAYITAYNAFIAANSTLYARVDPLGSTTGNYRFTSSKGVLGTMPAFGEIDAGTGDLMTIEGEFTHGGWTKSTIP